MSMNDVKVYLKSKTLWGILIAALPTILRVSGVPLPPGTDDLLGEVLVAIGSSIGVYGRVTATQRLAFRPGK